MTVEGPITVGPRGKTSQERRPAAYLFFSRIGEACKCGFKSVVEAAADNPSISFPWEELGDCGKGGLTVQVEVDL